MTSTRTKTYLYYLISFSIPIALLVITELSLRAFGYGKTYPLFIEAKGLPGYMQQNEEVINRFFPLPELAPKVSADTQYFLKEKPQDSFRIVVQGGSTAAGFPFGRWGSLSGMLQQRFKRLYPEKHIEIINTAMASVNSYTLLDFVDEIVAIKPDLVLIYAGHNEYLGVMGVGSAFAAKGGRAATLLYLTLKDFKLYQLIESVYYQLFSSSPDVQADERTLMAKVAKEKEIEIGSELYKKGLQQFSENLDFILSKYQKHNVKVLIGNLASNEKDHIPFSAIDLIDEPRVHSWSEISAEERISRIQKLTEELGASQGNLAAIHFELGHHFLLMSKYVKARKHLVLAKDNDLLRFRAPEDFNRILDSTSKKYEIPLVDVQGRIRQNEPDKIIGSEHMLEHLHPTSKGYFLLADAFLMEILNLNVLGDPRNEDTELAWIEMPISKADKLYGEFKIDRLTSDYPFKRKPHYVLIPSRDTLEGNALNDRIAGKDWLTINRELSPLYQRTDDFAEAALISGLLADAIPNDANLAYIAGLIYKRAENIVLSLHYLHRALKMKPNSITNHLSLAQNYFLLGYIDKSIKHLLFVKNTKPDHPGIDGLIARVKGHIR